MIRQCLNLAALCGMLLNCAGCSDMPTLAPVQGSVTYNGKPLANGIIVFYPEEGRSASGEIKNGEIVELTTFKPGDGVPVGHHKVTVQAWDKPTADMYTPRKSIVPAKYTDVKQTPLAADIESGVNDVVFDLTD